MDYKRLFVGNINRDITKNVLEKAFVRYGEIDGIELKQKTNLVDPNNPTHFAFVTIKIDDYSLNKCLNRFSEKDLNGQFLNVTIAKESFLEKLKKEREGDERKNSSYSINNFDKHKSPKQNNLINGLGKKTTFDSDDEICDEQVNTSLNNALENISESDTDDKPLNDNEKRLKSLKKLQKGYMHKQMLIKKSLCGLEIPNNKKIKFDFYESDDEETSVKIPSEKIDLFKDGNNDDSEDEAVNIKVSIKNKQKLESVGGRKLLKAQSKFNGDPRFKIDTNFLDDDEGNDDNEGDSDNESEQNDDNTNEKETQMRIMEEIVGRKLTKLVDPNRRELPKTMIRYDPQNEEHQELVNSITNNLKKSTKKSITTEKKIISNEQIKNVEVSKEQFYTINDDLTNSLKRRGDGFSLISMFGRKDDIDNENKKEQQINEKILVKSSNQNILEIQENPFKFDSSDSEDDESPAKILEKVSEVKDQNKTNKKRNKSKTKAGEGGKTTKSGVWVENFFMTSADKRLKEGSEFFKSNKQKEGVNGEEKEDYSKVMENLRQIIHKKISKTKKSMGIRHTHTFKKKLNNFKQSKKFSK